jgi:hypothetical protein
MIKIYFNSEFINDDYDEEEINIITGELTHVANVDTNELEYAYELSQNMNIEGWLNNDNVDKVCEDSRIRSSSMGDVFETENGDRYKISLIGFKKI